MVTFICLLVEIVFKLSLFLHLDNNLMLLTFELSIYNQARTGSRQRDQGQVECSKDKGYLEEMRVEKYKAVQGMEARNRWKLLESSTPAHDIVQLRVKIIDLTCCFNSQLFYYICLMWKL